MSHAGHHITPVRSLVIVFGALVFLTVITVISSRWDLGALNVPLALSIAILKATLVVTVFMALRTDTRVNALVLSLGVLFVSIFLIFTLFDTAFRGDLSNVDPQTISDIEAQEAAPGDVTDDEHDDAAAEEER